MISNLTREKGLYEFLNLAKESVGLDRKMILAGPANETDSKKILDFVEDGLIEWRGPVHGDDKEAVFHDIDILVFPKNYINEAQPTIIYEAYSYGKPAIARARGTISSQVQFSLAAISPTDDFGSEAMELLGAFATLIAPGVSHSISDAAYERLAEDSSLGAEVIGGNCQIDQYQSLVIE